MIRVETVEAAIELVKRSAFGNMACMFTGSGAAACKFRDEAEVGNIGTSIGATAPMAFSPFSGWKESLFGDLYGQGLDAVEFSRRRKSPSNAGRRSGRASSEMLW